MKAINILLAILVSIASVMAYGGGGSSYVYFKTTEDKKTGTTLSHYDTSKKEILEHKSNDFFSFNLNTKGLRYVDIYENKKDNSIVFRTKEVRTIVVKDIYGNEITIETNKVYDKQQLFSELSIKESNKAVIQFIKGTKKSLFGMESKGSYRVTTNLGTTDVHLFD